MLGDIYNAPGGASPISGTAPMQVFPSTLDVWNGLDAASAAAALLPCCGSGAWARSLTDLRPFSDEGALLAAAERVWYALSEPDWKEAFRSHPRIGEQEPKDPVAPTALAWSSSEQSTAMTAEAGAKADLREGNERYEQRFGHIFLICAQGRSAREILAEMERRLPNTAAAELLEAAREQAAITRLRLLRWLGPV